MLNIQGVVSMNDEGTFFIAERPVILTEELANTGF